jgi:hypothetical protein
MQREAIAASVGRLAVLCSILALGAMPLAYAKEARTPAVATKAPSTGARKFLDARSYPPGPPSRSVTAARASRNGGEKSMPPGPPLKSATATKASRSGGQKSLPPGPPNRSATPTKASNSGGKKSIIFVGGKKAETNKSAANTKASIAKKSNAGTNSSLR